VLTRTTCYEAYGTTPQELQASVAEEGPRANDRVAAAVTHWRLRWSYSLVADDAACEVERPDVQVVIVYLLPAWMPPAGTPDSTTEYWRNFSAVVRAHEAHHRSIAVDGGVAARKSLLDLPPGVTCPGVSDTADRRVRAVISRYEVKQRAFDAAAGG
jgi:predicted secreted Zn-dependent protease